MDYGDTPGDTPVFTFLFRSAPVRRPSAFGLRPRLSGVTARPRRRLIAPWNALSPSGRPISSLRRSAVNAGVVGASKPIAIASAGGSEAGARFFFPFYRIKAMVILSVRRGRRPAARLTRQACLIGRQWGGARRSPTGRIGAERKNGPRGQRKPLKRLVSEKEIKVNSKEKSR